MVHAGRFQRNSHVIRLDGNLAVTSVNEDSELDPGRSPLVGQGIERSPDGPPGKQDVVHKTTCAPST